MRFWRLHPGLILKRFLLATLIASVVSCWIFVYQVFNMDVPSRQSRKPPNFHVQKCQRPRKYLKSPLKLSYVDEIFAKSDNHTQNELEQTVLIVVRQPSSIFRTHVCDVLEANRIPYQNFFVGDKLPLSSVIDVNVGKFSTVIFESLDFYVSLESLSKKLLEQYCRKFSVGLVIFTQTETQVQDNFPHQVEGLDFKIQRGVKGLRNAELNEDSRLLRVTRAGGVITGTLPGSEWCVFFSDALNKSFESVELATKDTVLTAFNEDKNNKDLKRTFVSKKYTTILHDLGKVDGIQRVYFGSGLQFWLHKLIFVDALALMSRGKLSRPLDRWILVDIDDIFVGKSGSRMTLLDVEALLDAQKKIQLKVPGFRFNMGFSGAFFLDGDDEEDEGDWALLKNAHSFWWFSHMWGHMKPHEIKALNDLVYDMKINWEFAKTHGIPISLSYAVAPHHSGVYPTHDALYEAWQRVYQLKVTSTEEYPHLKPARKRRGFIYKNIKVLPRQTCGLFTHTLLLDRYPKGRQVLEESVFGGSVFQVLAHNPVNIFMTHLSNYGNDRLGIYVFESVINHLHCWTNLNFQSAHPVQLAEKYFQLFPADVEPLWQNPCTDKRHLDIWAEGKTCNRLPSFLVIGPQKTGTTALYTFLNMHPEIISSEPSVKTFEEIQFFNGQNYARGLDWYMDFFPDLGNSSKIQSFEKSANYFDVEKTAARLHALIPTAKLIVILIDPAKRAYSWYQHMHSHLHHAAVSNSFYTVLTKTVGNSGDKQLTNLGQRCLNPGHYAYHLERWLNYFPPSQILILDGDKLKDDPISVMDEVQNFLKVTVIDYKTKLRFDRRKGFFCQLLTNGRTKCLGRGKGRRYRPMDAASKAFLQKYYMAPNKRLADLLNKIKRPHPDWLRREISRYKKLAQ